MSKCGRLECDRITSGCMNYSDCKINLADEVVGAEHKIRSLESQLQASREALKEIALGQQPIDYAKPLVTIERLVGIAKQALGGGDE